MLVYVSSDDSLRCCLWKIDDDSPDHERERGVEIPDELVVRFLKADNEYEEVQKLVTDFLEGLRG